MDPNTESGQPADELDTGASAAAEAQEEITQTDAERAVDAFDEGAGLKEGDDDEGADDAGDAAVGDGGDGAPAGAGGKQPEPDETPEQRLAREKKEAEAAEAAEVDQTVKELGLKGKAEERFRDLTGRLKEATSKIEQLGGDEGLQRIVRDATDQREWDQKLSEIGCTPEQFGQAIGFIAAINSNQPEILRQARDNLLKEVALLDGRLGEKTERHDPLSSHPDLQAKVESGAMDEEDALEVVRLRMAAAAREQADHRQNQTAAQQQEQKEGMQQLAQLGESLKARDGEAVFTAVMASIGPDLNQMAGSMPPAQWKAVAERLYKLGLKAAQAQAQAPAALRPPRPGVKQPMRQQHGTRGAATVTKEHTDPMAAFDAGVEEVRARGA